MVRKDNHLHERKNLQNTQPVSNAKQSSSIKTKEDYEDKLVLWRSPFLTIYYFLQEVLDLLQRLWTYLYEYKSTLLSIGLVCLSVFVASFVKGPHQPFLHYLQDRLNWSIYWMGLGVLSSIGLGTGLHTFILYLGPHIASVTLAGYECGGLNFPEPPYPQQIICPTQIDPRWVVSVWNIMWKVRLESIMWGAGTAIGELPPYFMARAAKQSGKIDDDVQELENLKTSNTDILSLADKMKLIVHHLIQKVGFFGILACASIPNPLFDLAGITCGHFEVPFWRFFGATLLGKAVIKMMLQKLCVIIAFSDILIDRILDMLSRVPGVGMKLQSILVTFLQKQKDKLYNPTDKPNESSIIEIAYNCFVLAMILYFVLSIINSLALSNYKKTNKRLRLRSKKLAKD